MRSVDVGGGGVGVEHGGERRGPAQVEVAVVLPGEADAAVHLDVEVGALVGGRHGQRGGDGRGVGELLAAAGGGAGRVPHRGGGQLGGHDHVGAVVLDRLEHGDRAAELQAHLGVLGGHVGALAGHADGLGGEDRAGEVDRAAGGRRAAPSAGDAVERDPAGAAGRVEVRRRLDGDAVGVGVDDGDVVADGDEQHVGQAGAEHGAGVAGQRAVAQRRRRRRGPPPR